MNKSRVVFVTTVFVAAISGLAEAPPNHIDLSKFPATQLDDVVVPLPRFVLFFSQRVLGLSRVGLTAAKGATSQSFCVYSRCAFVDPSML
jgi:hypothetical protein